jgi:hypothetical protein
VAASQRPSISPPSNVGSQGRWGGKCKASTSSISGDGEQSRRPRKERNLNWNRLEMIALVCAKRAEFSEELQANDPCELMSSEMTKWDHVSLSINAVAGITYFRSVEACKYK